MEAAVYQSKHYPGLFAPFLRGRWWWYNVMWRESPGSLQRPPHIYFCLFQPPQIELHIRIFTTCCVTHGGGGAWPTPPPPLKMVHKMTKASHNQQGLSETFRLYMNLEQPAVVTFMTFMTSSVWTLCPRRKFLSCLGTCAKMFQTLRRVSV